MYEITSTADTKWYKSSATTLAAAKVEASKKYKRAAYDTIKVAIIHKDGQRKIVAEKHRNRWSDSDVRHD